MHPHNVEAINGPPPLTCSCEEGHVQLCDLLIDTVILMLQDTTTSASNLVHAMDSLKRELLREWCPHDRHMNFRARYVQPSILDPEHEALNAPAPALTPAPAPAQGEPLPLLHFYPEDDGIEFDSDEETGIWITGHT